MKIEHWNEILKIFNVNNFVDFESEISFTDLNIYKMI